MDRETVIKALECRKNADKRCGNPCEEIGMCHYATAVRGLDGDIYRPFVCDRERICADAIALLKEQKAVEPIITPWKTDDNGDVIVAKRECGNCGWMFFTENPNFCENCGRPVKWE